MRAKVWNSGEKKEVRVGQINSLAGVTGTIKLSERYEISIISLGHCSERRQIIQFGVLAITLIS